MGGRAALLVVLIAACAGGREAPRRLTFLSWGLSEAEVAELGLVAPNVRVLDGLSPEEALARAAEIDGMDAHYASPELLERAERLTWIQSRTVGVDSLLSIPGVRERDRVVVTNIGAASAPAVADHAIGLLVVLAPDLFALAGKTALVLGLGNVGGEIARRARRLGMRVNGIRRTDAPAPDGVDRVGRPGDLAELLSTADVVFVALPLTAETERLLDARALLAMKPGAIVINVARGRIVDTAALTEALAAGRLGGAGLDVTEPEPLPADHPLRRMPNVIVTPHVAGRSPLAEQAAWRVLRENVRRFGAGEPLIETVDKRAGY